MNTMNPQWLLFGGRGWIGQQLVACIPSSVHVVYADPVRADDPVGVRALFAQRRWDRVVCLAGRTRVGDGETVDSLESREHLPINLRDNLLAALVVAHLAKEYGVHLTYIGTGCLFEGDADTRFHEWDDPNFYGSAYSIVKGTTDRILRGLFDAHVLNVRIRMPISAAWSTSSRDLVYKLVRYARTASICDTTNSMTVLPDLLPRLVQMIEWGVTGTVHLVNPGAMTHTRLLELYRAHVDPTLSWTTCTLDEQDKRLAARRSRCVLDTALLERLFPGVPDVEAAVTRLFTQK
jgi:3,5-epimerase/4-reductase